MSPLAEARRDTRPAAVAGELRRLAVAISAAQPEDAPEILRSVPAVWVVEQDGHRFDVPAVWMRRALLDAVEDASRWPDVRRNTATRLNALAHEADLLAVRTADDAHRARASLERVLAAPEFRRKGAQSAMARLRERLADALARLWQRIARGGLASRTTAVALAWATSLLALAMLAAWAIRTLRRSTRPTRLEGSDAVPSTLSARAWALKARAAPDPREAARCAYRAAVRRLEEEGAWHEDDARTPREYRRLLPPGHERQPIVSDVTSRFEEIWYGAREATDDDRRTLLERLTQLRCLP